MIEVMTATGILLKSPPEVFSDDTVPPSHNRRMRKICWEPLDRTGLSSATVSLKL